MQSNFQRCLDLVLIHEGGFVDHPKDPGGITNMGVTKKAWEEYVGHDVTREEMRSLTVAEITPFYRKRYWDACKCDDLPVGLDYVVFDIAVNSGTRQAAKFLQSAVGATTDGVIGNGTIACVKRTPITTSELIAIICTRRELFYRSLSGFPTFGRGWLRRNDEVKNTALLMVGTNNA